MGDDWIAKQISRTNRNLFLLGSLLVGAVGISIAIAWEDARGYLLGPTRVPFASLRDPEKSGLSKNAFITVEGQSSFESGTRVVKSGHPENVLGEIVVLVMDHEILLVKTPSYKPEAKDFKGRLVDLPNELRSMVERNVNSTHPGLRGTILPRMLDASGLWNSDAILVAVFGGFFVLLGLWFIGLSLKRFIQPETHPLLAKLALYGEVDEIRKKLDDELAREAGGETLGPLQLTSNWLFHGTAFKTGVMATQDVVWAYPKVTRHYHNGIRTGTIYTVMIRDAKGQGIEIRGKKDTVPKMMESLTRRMPGILVGFSKELEELWKKKRPAFLEMVEKAPTPKSAG